jgi:hypothetical protein
MEVSWVVLPLIIVQSARLDRAGVTRPLRALSRVCRHLLGIVEVPRPGFERLVAWHCADVRSALRFDAPGSRATATSDPICSNSAGWSGLASSTWMAWYDPWMTANALVVSVRLRTSRWLPSCPLPWRGALFSGEGYAIEYQVSGDHVDGMARPRPGVVLLRPFRRGT